jgi:hypothetical protein
MFRTYQLESFEKLNGDMTRGELIHSFNIYTVYI